MHVVVHSVRVAEVRAWRSREEMLMQRYCGGGLGSLKEESIACAADKGGSSDGHEIGTLIWSNVELATCLRSVTTSLYARFEQEELCWSICRRSRAEIHKKRV